MEFIAHRREKDNKNQSVTEHLYGVAKWAAQFMQKIGLSEIGELIGLLHDLGKYSQIFQNYIKSATNLINQDEDDYINVENNKGKIDHSSAGAQYIWNKLENITIEYKMLAEIVSLCIASHHSGLIDCISPDGSDIFTRRMKKSSDLTHFLEVKSVVETAVINRVNKIIANAYLKESVMEIIEKIKKSVYHKKQLFHFYVGLLSRFIYSCLIDADRIDTADFENPMNKSFRNYGQYVSWEYLIEKLDKKLQTFQLDTPVNKIRSDVSLQCLDKSRVKKGIYTLTVPTGGGKTLSSLRFALNHAKIHKLDRIFYIIPYTSIIDQNADEVRNIFEENEVDDSIVLECHSNIIFENKKTQWREKLLTENWDSPIVFTTSVQFLECIFGSGTRNARRMHQIANSMIIFDEIQTLPIRTVHLFNNAINFLVDFCGSSVVLCTATQPLLGEVDATKGSLKIDSSSEIIKDIKKLFSDLKRVEIINKRKENGEWSDVEIAQFVKKILKKSKNCLIIVNTKSKAKSVYKQCERSSYIDEDNIFHLSTNMCAAHRLDVLAEIHKKLDKIPLVCISTQLIEAGIDIDFNCVIRSIAGMDSIAQAAGRCNRHGTREKGFVYVINPESENISMLPDIFEGRKQTERIFREFRKDLETTKDNWLNPDIMERYFQYYFFNRKDEMAYSVGKEYGFDDTLLNMLSTNNNAVSEYKRKNRDNYPDIILRQSFMTANKIFRVIGAGTQGIIVPYGKTGEDIIGDLCASFELEKDYNLLKRAQRFTVNVYPYMIQKLVEADAIFETQENSGIYCLKSEYYSNKYGLSDEIVNDMNLYII